MRKTLIVLVLLLTVPFMTFANGTAEMENAGGGKIELEFWDMVWGPTEYPGVGKEVVERFNESQDEIHVTYISKPWTNWFQTFMTAYASGTLPDVFTTGDTLTFSLFDEGAVMPLDDIREQWDSDGTSDKYIPGSLDYYQYKGHQVAIPFGMDVRVLWYRKDILAAKGYTEPPKTWAELREIAKAVTEGDTYGFAFSGTDSQAMQAVHSLLVNNGGGFFSSDKLAAGLSTPESMEALNFIADMVADGSIPKSAAGWDSNQEYQNNMAQGKLAMVYTVPNFNVFFSEEDQENLGIAPAITSFNGGKGVFGSVNPIIVSNDTKHAEAAKTFAVWWSQNMQDMWVEGHQTQFPANGDFYKLPYFADNEDTMFIKDQWLPVSVPFWRNQSQPFPGVAEIQEEGVLQNLAQKLLSGEDPADFVGDIEDRINDIIEANK
jgi:multiple sugar transport system substrate-binding protein